MVPRDSRRKGGWQYCTVNVLTEEEKYCRLKFTPKVQGLVQGTVRGEYRQVVFCTTRGV